MKEEDEEGRYWKEWLVRGWFKKIIGEEDQLEGRDSEWVNW